MAGSGSDPHKFIQEIGHSRAGYLEVLAIAHDHFSSISADILFDLFQVDERGIMNSRVIAFRRETDDIIHPGKCQTIRGW